MSKEAVEQVIQRASKDPDFYQKMEAAVDSHKVLDGYDLSAEERHALVKKDSDALKRVGVAQHAALLADWCTGE